MESEKRGAQEAALSALKTQIFGLLSSAQPETHERLFGQVGISTERRFEFVRTALASFEKERPFFPWEADRIPKLIHRMWLTNPKEPRLPPDAYLARIREQARRLSDFEIVFWVNCDAVASHIAQTFDAAALGRPAPRMASLDALKDEPIHARIESAIAARKFVLAGDIFKHFLIARFGGIYADLGIDFGRDLADLVLKSDVALFLATELFCQPAFMAAPAGSRPFRLFHKLMLAPEILAALCLTETEHLSPGVEIWMHGGIAFTISLMLFDDGSDRILLVPPNKGLLHHESLGTWYRKTDNFGGVTLENATVTHLDLLKLELIRSHITALGAVHDQKREANMVRRIISEQIERELIMAL